MIAQREKYKEYHRILLKTKRTARQLYYQNLCKEFRHNSQKLWKLINSISCKTNNKCDIVNHLKVDNIEVHKRDEIATVFAKLSLVWENALQRKSPLLEKRVLIT